MRLNRSLLLAVLCTLTIALAGCADKLVGPSPAPSAPAVSGYILLGEKAAAAYSGLQADTVFASSSIGVGGSPSAQGRWYRTLLSLPNAAAVFRQLWRGATPAGRLYALMGLQQTDPSALDHLARFSLEDRTVILQISGCVGRWVTVGSIAAQITSGQLGDSFQPYAGLAIKEARQDSLDELAGRQAFTGVLPAGDHP